MSRIAKIIFKRSKVGKLFLTDIKTYFEATLQYGTDAEIFTLMNKTEQRAQGKKILEYMAIFYMTELALTTMKKKGEIDCSQNLAEIISYQYGNKKKYTLHNKQ